MPDALQFAGREYDSETQLYYNRARYYDPAVGRFVSEDPEGLSAGINLYAYVGNDPVNGRDGSGLCSDSPDDGTSSGSGDKEKNAAKHAEYVKCVIESAKALLAEQGMTLDEALANAQDNFGGDMFCTVGGCGQGYNVLFSPTIVDLGSGIVPIHRASEFEHCNAFTADFSKTVLMNGWDVVRAMFSLTRDGRPTWQDMGQEGMTKVARYEGTVNLIDLRHIGYAQMWQGHVWVDCVENSGDFELDRQIE